MEPATGSPIGGCAARWATSGRTNVCTLPKDAHGGKYCLQLDPPQKGEKFIRAYPVHGAFRSGARYRVSVWIKSASPTGVYANIGGQVLGAGQTGPGWKRIH